MLLDAIEKWSAAGWELGKLNSAQLLLATDVFYVPFTQCNQAQLIVSAVFVQQRLFFHSLALFCVYQQELLITSLTEEYNLGEKCWDNLVITESFSNC